MEFQIKVDIAAPPALVWDVMSDGERWAEWTASIANVRWLDQGPLRVASRALIRQPRFPPARWAVKRPGRSFTWKSGAPGLWVYGHQSLEPTANGTCATLRLFYEGALARLMGRLTAGITNRYLGMEAAGLKLRSEATWRTNATAGVSGL